MGSGQKPVPGIMCSVKRRRSFVSKVLLILAFACAMSVGTVAEGSPPPGRLIVQRVPNFGWNRAFHLQIDGMSVATIVQDRRYDGWVSAGPQVLTVSKVTFVRDAESTSATVNNEAGWACVFI